MNKSLLHLLFTGVLLAFPAGAHGQPAAFWGLDPLPGGADISYCYAMSTSGRIIAGESFSALSTEHGEGLRWILHANLWVTNGIGLPTNPPTGKNSGALGLSSNGKMLVGRVSFAQTPPSGFETLPYCWTADDGFKFLLPPPEYSGAQAQSATAGASTVVGWGWTTNDIARGDRYTAHPRALVWRGSLSAGWQVAELEPAHEGLTTGVDVSGKLIIGWARSPSSVVGSSNGVGHEAVSWVRQNHGEWQTRWLGALPHSEIFSQANGLARGSGKYVVGFSGDPLLQMTPVRWTLHKNKAPRIESLGLPAGFQNGFAEAVSANGRRVVGCCSFTRNDDFFSDTFVWDEGTGASLLQARLIDLGVTAVKGWSLTCATGISDDGRTICGYGTNPDGIERAWVASLPQHHKG